MKYLADMAKKYIEIRPKDGGVWCLVEPHDVASVIDCDDPADYETREVWVKPSVLEKMKEFEGW